MTSKLTTSKRRARELHKVLAAILPALFSLENPVPFKIGLRADVLREFPAIEPKRVDDMFRWLVNRRAYLARCTAGAERHGLSGPEGPKVTPGDAEFAKIILARRNGADLPIPPKKDA